MPLVDFNLPSSPQPALRESHWHQHVNVDEELSWAFVDTKFFRKDADIYLPLRKLLRCRERDGIVTVRDWGIDLPAAEFDTALSGAVVRTYLFLLAQAQSFGGIDAMSEEDYKRWVAISDYVDYARYCTDIEPPRHVEGSLLEVGDGGWKVQWFDGEIETIPATIGESSLRWLISSDLTEPIPFRALAKWNHEDKLITLTNVMPVPVQELNARAAWIDGKLAESGLEKSE